MMQINLKFSPQTFLIIIFYVILMNQLSDELIVLFRNEEDMVNKFIISLRIFVQGRSQPTERRLRPKTLNTEQNQLAIKVSADN